MRTIDAADGREEGASIVTKYQQRRRRTNRTTKTLFLALDVDGAGGTAEVGNAQALGIRETSRLSGNKKSTFMVFYLGASRSEIKTA